MLLFGSMGAITWAIRGTDGWGGVEGSIIPGLTWGLLWYYVCRRKGIDARTIPLWLGLGIAIGGELGYGQYVSWIRGWFETPSGPIPVAAWMGYAWFVICGIGWGGPGGIALGWGLGGKAPWRRWGARLLVPLGVAFAGWLLVQALPGLFFPNHSLGIYAGELDRHLLRTVETNTLNFMAAAWVGGALLVAAFQRDWVTVRMGMLIGGGFGIGFALAAVWCLGYVYAPDYIDWWKMWELNAGFNLGLLYAIGLHWATRIRPAPGAIDARRRDMSLLFAVFLLLFVLFFGGTSRMSVVLGLYADKAVGQYEWPVARMVLFAPFAAVILGATLCRAGRILTGTAARLEAWLLAARMTDLMTVITVVGLVTIWPSKIGILYGLFLCAALFAFQRLNRHYDEG